MEETWLYEMTCLEGGLCDWRLKRKGVYVCKKCNGELITFGYAPAKVLHTLKELGKEAKV